MKYISFRIQLVLAFAILLIVQGAAVGAGSFMNAKKIVEEVRKKELAEIVNRIDININMKIHTATGLLEGFHLGVGSGMEGGKLSFEGEEYLKSIQNAIPASGIIWMSRKEVVGFPKGAESLDRELLRKYERLANASTARTMWLRESEKETGEWIIGISKVCSREDNGQDGLLICRMDSNAFGRSVMGYEKHFLHQLSYIVDGEGQIIATNNSQIDQQMRAQMETQFQAGRQSFEMRVNGRKYYVCGQYNGLTAWKTFSAVWKEDIFPQSGLLKRVIILFVSLISIAAFGAVYLVACAVVQPIHILIRSMERIQEGDFDLQIPNRRRDEIGQLTASFNFMVRKIRTLIGEVYEKQLEQKNAELRALQAQINPHFLYNTLDTVNWMLIDQSEFEVSRIIVSLGKMMKYVMNNGEILVSAEEEFQYLESYLLIQKARMESRLNYELRMEPELKTQRIPKLLIQPLVENAVIHGIEASRNGGTVWVSAETAGAEIEICIRDNGCGMHMDESAKKSRQKKGGIGLENVKKRMLLYYGTAYTIHIESEPGAGTKIYFRIPRSGEGMGHENCGSG